MASHSTLKLMVQCPYGNSLKVSGPIGARPDTRILGGRNPDCARSKLPSFLDRLLLTFPRSDTDREIVQNFYHHDDFFVGTRPILEFFHQNVPAGIEVSAVTVRHDDGSASEEPYFAIKVTRTIDCIDPVNSLAGHDGNIPFSDMITQYELDATCAAEYANVGKTRYVSQPRLWQNIGAVRLVDKNLPSNAPIFQPAFWPGYLLISKDASDRLNRLCTGYANGYYFWTLDLGSVSQSHSKLCQDLR
jgi:hypothetical protein